MKEHLLWGAKAEQDLAAAKYNYEGKFYDVTAFLCQQAVEKALKGLYIKKFGKIYKIHDLVTLGKSVHLSAKLSKYCKEITAAYIYARYPDVPSVKDAEKSSSEFIEQTEKILQWIKKRLQ